LLINKGKSVVFRQQDAIITFEKTFTLRRKKMNPGKIFTRLSVICVLLATILITGCAAPAKQGKAAPAKSPVGGKKVEPIIAEPVKTTTKTAAKPKETTGESAAGGAVLALKFIKGDTSIYKVIMETERSADFAGEITKDEQFTSGKSGTRTEMIFSQQIENVDANGNATAKITIKSLRYIAITKDVQLLDFDSSKQGQQANALNKLIGQSYTIIITPTSNVIGATGQDEIKGLVEGNAMENKAAVQLVSKNLIQRRHQISALMDAGGKILKVGEKWSSTRTVSFGSMGTNSLEKICTLKAIEEKEGKRTAVVEISGIPATIQKDATSPVAKLFDSTNSYTGTLLLDLNNGKIERYTEKLEAEWVVADPQATGGEPSIIKLGTKELNSLEKIE
jgi:hypothetical protein